MRNGAAGRVIGDYLGLRGSVLVAEGDSEIRQCIVEGLTDAGIASTEAPTHQIALAKLWGDQTIDVIIADWRLPGGSGIRLIDTAQAALGRYFESIVLAPMGSIPHHISIEPRDVVTVVRATTVCLDHVAAHHRCGGTGGIVRRGPKDEAPETLFECLAVAAEQKDNETGRHNRRIGLYAKALAESLGWSPARQADIEIAAKLHDIGKIGITDNILFKPGELTEAERLVMQRHTTIGHNILSAAANPLLALAAGIARHHHERWCGDGYPDGLKGQDIPIEARVTALCDVYDALRSERPYKDALSHKNAIAIIRSGDDRTHTSHFDPDILAATGAIENVFEQIFTTLIEP